MQHESQELTAWLAAHQDRAVQQLKTLTGVLDSHQNAASALEEQVSGHQANIAMLTQKEQQYAQQLCVLEEKLTSAKYSPLVCTQSFPLHWDLKCA